MPRYHLHLNKVQHGHVTARKIECGRVESRCQHPSTFVKSNNILPDA